MRLRASSLALAGVLVASGGALAAATTSAPDREVRAAAEAKPTPPGQAKRAEGRPTPPGQAKRAETKAERRAADSEGNGRAQGRGPDATGPAAYGLCRAWAAQQDPAGKAARGVPPFRNLAAAAGGAERVTEYCAELPDRPAADDD